MKIDKYIYENSRLFTLIENVDFPNELELIFKKYFTINYKREIAKLKRLTKIDFELYGENFLPLPSNEKEKLILICNGYSLFNGVYEHKSKINKILTDEKIEFQNKGFILNPANKKISDIRLENLFFYKNQHIIKYLLETDSNLEFIKITDNFLKKINNIFNAKIKNKRAFISLLERQVFLRKIESDTFSLRKKNEKYIAAKIVEVISKYNYKFLTKKYQKLLLNEVIRDYDLKSDEYYYILKNYYPQKYIYSSGNSMTISKSKEISKMNSQERIDWYIRKKPAILSFESISFELGISEFISINFNNCYALNDEIILIDFKNQKNVQYLKNTFNKFLKNKSEIMFSISDFRNFLKLENSFFKKLSELYSFSYFFEELYGEEMKYFENLKKYLYIKKDIKNNIIDVDDWNDF